MAQKHTDEEEHAPVKAETAWQIIVCKDDPAPPQMRSSETGTATMEIPRRQSSTRFYTSGDTGFR
eukprot:6539816-Alexandrium_andersonii.AAC.1